MVMVLGSFGCWVVVSPLGTLSVLPPVVSDCAEDFPAEAGVEVVVVAELAGIEGVVFVIIEGVVPLTKGEGCWC